MYKKAFTIIELIVVITISSILLGGGAITYTRNTEEQSLQTEAEKVANMMKLAHTRSIVGDAGENSDESCPRMTGYQVTIDRTNYGLDFCCLGDCQGRSVDTGNFPANITAETRVTSTTAIGIRFHTISTEPVIGERGMVETYHIAFSGGNFALNKLATDYPITLRHNGLGQCIDLSVTDTGIVTIGERYTAGC